MVPPISDLLLAPSRHILPYPYFTQKIPASSFHLPTAPLYPPPSHAAHGPQLIQNSDAPGAAERGCRASPTFNPCACQVSPQLSTVAVGASTPMLGGPDEIALSNTLVPLQGTLGVIQLAFKRAAEAAMRDEGYHCPLVDGEIIVNNMGVPSTFVPGPTVKAIIQEVFGPHALAREGIGTRAPPVRPAHEDGLDLSLALPIQMGGLVPPLLLAGNLNAGDSDQDSGPDLNVNHGLDVNEPPAEDPPARKSARLITYSRRAEQVPAEQDKVIPRRSSRIRQMHDGERIGSVQRAEQRRAISVGYSDTSSGSTSRRRKTRRLPDINMVAEMPVTSEPADMSMEKLEQLADCCGIATSDVIAYAKEIRS